MARGFTIERVEDDAAWDRFNESSPEGTVFTGSAWLRASCGDMGSSPYRMTAAVEAGRPVAAIACARTVRGPLAKAHTPVLTPYGGLLFGPDVHEDIRLEAADILISRLEAGHQAALLAHPPGMGDMRPFTWRGWNARPRYTYLLDIGDPDAAIGRFRQRARRKLQNAGSRLGIEVIRDADLAADLHGLAWRDRRKRPPLPRDRVARLLADVVAGGLVELSIARNGDGPPVGMLALVIGGGTVYTWLYGSRLDAADSDADTLLISDAIRRHAAPGRRMDLVGANIPSIAFFKEGFGGVLTPYYACERYSSIWPRLAFQAYRTVKRLLP